MAFDFLFTGNNEDDRLQEELCGIEGIFSFIIPGLGMSSINAD